MVWSVLSGLLCLWIVVSWRVIVGVERCTLCPDAYVLIRVIRKEVTERDEMMRMAIHDR